MPGLDETSIKNSFTYHAPHGDQVRRYEEIREAGLDLARHILNLTPASAEQTTAIRKVQEAVMFANAAIAIGEAPEEIREAGLDHKFDLREAGHEDL